MAANSDIERIAPGQIYQELDTPQKVLEVTRRLNHIEHILAGKTGSFNCNSEIPAISSGVAAPTTAPAKIGNVFCDTVAGKVYIAVGATASADWKILN